MDTAFLEIIFIAILIVLNGFFACSEFAIISIRKSRVAQLVAEGDERAKVVEEQQKDPPRLLAGPAPGRNGPGHLPVPP